MIAFNKMSNTLRRLDEAEPQNTRMSPSDVVHGGFSAAMARNQRGAKSRRKMAAISRPSRRMS